MRFPFGPSKDIQERNAELIKSGLGGLGRIGGPGYTGWGHAQPDKLYRLNAEQGWGTLVTRTHTLENGTTLGMQFSLPDGYDFFDRGRLDGAPDSTRHAAAYVSSDRLDLAHATERPGIFLAGAICPRDDLSDLLMTVTLRVGKGWLPLKWKEGELTDDGAEVGDCGPFVTPHNGQMDTATIFYHAHTPQVQARMIYQVTRKAGDGALALTFSTEHDGGMGMWGRELVTGIGWSLWAGPESKLAAPPASGA